MRRLVLASVLMLVAGCGPDLPPAGGGGGAAVSLPFGPALPQAAPAEPTVARACPVYFAEALEAAIGAVEPRVARDALEFDRRMLDKAIGASETVRRMALGRLQAQVRNLEARGLVSPAQAGEIADLAACYMER